LTSDANRGIVRRLYDEAINQRKYDVLDELVAPNFILHSAILGEIRGGEAYKQSAQALLKASEDIHATVDDLIGGENDTVIARLTYRGADTGGFVKGHLATGKPFEFTAIYVWRLANGKLAELWQEADQLRLMRQLGLIAA
jgi:predicted ester cyclase